MAKNQLLLQNQNKKVWQKINYFKKVWQKSQKINILVL
jgi:hypothetical protein